MNYNVRINRNIIIKFNIKNEKVNSLIYDYVYLYEFIILVDVDKKYNYKNYCNNYEKNSMVIHKNSIFLSF